MKKRKEYSRFIPCVASWKHLKKGEMIELLHHCVATNNSSFHTSNFLGENHIGKLFGIALAESGLNREEIQLISSYASAKTDLVSFVDQALLRLRTDYLDLILLDFPTDLEKTQLAVEQLSAQGKLMEVGSQSLSNKKNQAMGIEISAQQVGFPVRSLVSLKALLAASFLSEEIEKFFFWEFGNNSEEIGVLDGLAKKYELSGNQLLLAWILQHPNYYHPVVSISSEQELSEIMITKDVFLNPKDWQEIHKILS